MWRNKEMLVIFLVVTGFPVARSVREALVVGGNEQFLNQALDQLGDIGKNTILFPEFENDLEKEVVVQASENIEENVKIVSQSKTDEGDENEGFRFKRRSRRQLQTGPQSLLGSVSQECDGITLRWKSPNIPFSPKYHTSNSEFSHYNIYRETNYFSSVAGLTPIASGKDHPGLKTISIYNKWTDKLPPTGTGLFYAVTVVDQKGVETPTVVPKQITFFGSIEKTGVNPTRIIPNILKGDILHHSLALNKFRNEYMVAFDLDVNKDGRPDQVFAIRVNTLGQIVDRRILNATVGMASTEQGRPSVAFNPATQQYLITFQMSAPAFLGGVSVVVGQKVLAHQTDRFQNPFVLLKATGNGGVRVPALEPKIIYNSATGGFAMAAMINTPPKKAFAITVTADGKITSVQPLFNGEVFDINLFMDTKARQVNFVYQIQQWAATVVDKAQHSKLKSYAYLVALSKMNATGGLLTFGAQKSVRFLVGFTREKHANIAGYANDEKGCLTVFWNNEENGNKIIDSSNIFGVPGGLMREENAHNCPTRSPVRNPASCFLPNNNGHILLWEEGSRVGGFLVKDDTFHPVLGEQRRPQLVYNQQQRGAFAVWQQKVGGDFVLFVRNVHPGSQFSCRTACNLTEKCAMKDVCAPRNPVVSKYVPTCAQNKGGCSHTCLPNSQGRKCSCPLSHSLSLDGMTCFLKDAKPDVSLLYSSMDSIWSVSVYYKEKKTSFTRIPIQGQEIVSFFYNKKDKYLYWADAKRQTINRALLDGSKKDELFNSQILVPDGMVVDPDAKHLYWTDMIFKSVFRSSLDGNSRVPFISGLDKPRALTLHQRNKWLYWSDWGASPKIERINTDGSARKIIVINGLGWPNGLTVDGSHLYWADAQLDKMEMSDLDGQHRLVIAKQGLAHPYGLDISGNRLYWTDWAGDIRSLDKASSITSIDIIAVGITKPYCLQVYDGTALTTATFCTDPGTPSFGGRNPSPGPRGNYNIGDRVLFTCNPGLVHLGSNERHCLATGKWSGTDTQCKALPVFTTIPQNKTANVGDTVSLGCSAVATSGQRATIQWYKNGKTMQSSTRYSLLSFSTVFVIFNAVVDDTGTYTCSATNDAGVVQTSMYLRIKSQSVADCGKAKFRRSSKIRGGQRATPGSIPWQIMLWDKTQKRPFCGGSLLNARWGVTAAHCLQNFQFSDIEVILGEYDWGISEKREQNVSIDAVHLYPQYGKITFNSDIALFHFKTDVIMTDYIKPICLPVTQTDQALLHSGNIGVISGWGARKMNKKKKTRSVRKLHEVEVPIVSQLACKQNHHKYVVTPNMFCAGRLNGQADACKGDSGGPLTIEHNATGRSVLLGIVSWGDKKCGAINKYGVYTKVSNYINWIASHIKLM